LTFAEEVKPGHFEYSNFATEVTAWREENPMRPLFWMGLIASALLMGGGVRAKPQQEKEPLKLVQKIPLPNVKGRIDHIDVDVKGKRLFVAGLENGTLEVVDLNQGKLMRSIPGFKAPQGIAYIPSANKIFVASNDDGVVRVFRGDTLELLDTIKLDLGANRVAYDPRAGVIYVGYGGKVANKDKGEVGIIDVKTNKHIGDIDVGLRAAEILMDKSGQTLFVFDNIASKIQVIDNKKREMVSAWQVSSQRPGDGAFDETNHRLLIGTRVPPTMTVMDSTTGKEIMSLPTVEGMDGVYYDAVHKRVYVSGGRDSDVGYVFVYQQQDADHYTQIGKIPTRTFAGTAFWCPELNRYYVAAAGNDKEEAAILVFEPQP
jgi:DNA-binding beta-propeller fold protein YncE